MTIEQLRYFVAVARVEHVTRAAAELDISQPALSRALRRLEAELEAVLFHREARVLRLTEPGRRFLVRAQRALGEVEAGRAELRESHSVDRGTVRLAFLHTLGTWLVPDLLRAHRALRPAVEYSLTQNGAGAMHRALVDDEVDVVLTSPRPDDPALSFAPLVVEPLWLALPPGHRLALRSRVPLADVAEEPFVMARRGYGLRTTAEELCARAGFAPRVAFEGEDVETLRGLVSAGLGVALLPLGRTSGQLLSPPTPHVRIADRDRVRTIGIAWHAQRRLLPAAAAFRDWVRVEGARIAETDGSSRSPRRRVRESG
jgi:LysR family transcriptional activator of glutamate synthase operon